MSCRARRVPLDLCINVQPLLVRAASSGRSPACCSLQVPGGVVSSEWFTAGGSAGRGSRAGSGLGRFGRQMGALTLAGRVLRASSGLVGAGAGRRRSQGLVAGGAD